MAEKTASIKSRLRWRRAVRVDGSVQVSSPAADVADHAETGDLRLASTFMGLTAFPPAASAHRRVRPPSEPEAAKSTIMPGEPSTPEVCDRPGEAGLKRGLFSPIVR